MPGMAMMLRKNSAPKAGMTVIYYESGAVLGAQSGKITRVRESGYDLELKLRDGREVRAMHYAPGYHVGADGLRIPGSWDFIV
jgi:hypothetical protein